VLKAGEQRVLRHAAVFPGGFDLEAARGVLGDKSNPPSIISDRLSVLVERSLVEFDPTPGLERYRLLDTVRAFASLRLIEAGEDSSCRHRHMRYYAALADRAEVELHGPVQSHWLRRLDNELGNLRAAFAWALESGEIDAGLRLASLGRFWATRCRYEEGLEWLDEAIAQSDEVPGALRAAALRTRAWLLMHRRPDLHHDGEGDMERAREDSREASELYLQLGDRTEWARCRLLVGNAEFLAGRKDAAQTIYEEVLRVDREVGNRGGEAACLGNLSRIHLMRGNDEGALPLLEQALVIAREMGDLGKVQSSLRDMGNIHERRRDDLQAWKLWEEGLALAQETGDQQQELTMLVLLAIGTGSQAELAADPTASQGYWDRALQLASEIPTGAAELHVLTNYAEFLLRSGAYAKARSVLSRAVPLALDRGESLWGALGALLLAEIVCREGAAGQAMELLGAARAGSFDITSRPHMRELDAGIVELARESLSAERADALLEKGARTDLKTAVALALSQQAE
jgi:tetratricopeptide (TPR) repeat protein